MGARRQRVSGLIIAEDVVAALFVDDETAATTLLADVCRARQVGRAGGGPMVQPRSPEAQGSCDEVFPSAVRVSVACCAECPLATGSSLCRSTLSSVALHVLRCVSLEIQSPALLCTADFVLGLVPRMEKAFLHC